MFSDKKSINLIICTKNCGENIHLLFDSLECLEYDGYFLLIIVDDRSDDGVSLQYCQEFSQRCKFNCLVIESDGEGNSAGRNRGLEVIDGDIVVFIDDDCYPEADFLNQWAAVFQSPNIGYGSGRILKYQQDQSDIGCQYKSQPEPISPGSFIARGTIQGSNMAFRKTCLINSGIFDERFGAGTQFAGEDWELSIRSSYAGWEGGYFPGPAVKHNHGRSGETAKQRLLYYDYGAGAVYAKCWNTGLHLVAIINFIKDILKTKGASRKLKLLQGWRAYMKNF